MPPSREREPWLTIRGQSPLSVIIVSETIEHEFTVVRILALIHMDGLNIAQNILSLAHRYCPTPILQLQVCLCNAQSNEYSSEPHCLQKC